MLRYTTEISEVDLNFKYPDVNDPILSELKTIADIGIDPNISIIELEKVKAIIGYAHSLFTHNGDNIPSSSDPLTIIKEAQSGKSFRCVEYSLLATALLWAYAVPVRIIGLKTSDVETREYGAGHVVIEFWGSDFQKWIMCDVQAGVITKASGILLSAVELGQKIGQNVTLEYIPVNHSRFSTNRMFGDKETYADWVRQYLYFFDTPIKISLSDTDRQKEQIAMLVPLGITSPKMFQGMFMMNAVYTHSVLDFYPVLTNIVTNR